MNTDNKPEDIAKELVYKFYKILKLGNLYPTTTYGHAKQCALIAVGEILNLDPKIGLQQEIFCQQVKIEIEKL